MKQIRQTCQEWSQGKLTCQEEDKVSSTCHKSSKGEKIDFEKPTRYFIMSEN